MKYRSHKDLLNKIDMARIANILQFLVDGGWPRECKKRFPTEYEYLRKQIKNFNDASQTDFGVHDVMHDLGGDFSIKNNPSDKRLIKPLMEFIEKHGSLKDLFTLNNDLYFQVNQRAKDNSLVIKKYLQELMFDYPGLMKRNELIAAFIDLAEEDGSIPPEKVPEDLNKKLKEAAKTDKSKKQVVLITSSNPTVHLAGEQSMAVDQKQYIEIIQARLDKKFKPNGNEGIVCINAGMLKEEDMYNVIRNAREVLGHALTMTIGEFISAYFKGYDYDGYNTKQSVGRQCDKSLLRVKITLEDFTAIKN